MSPDMYCPYCGTVLAAHPETDTALCQECDHVSTPVPLDELDPELQEDHHDDTRTE